MLIRGWIPDTANRKSSSTANKRERYLLLMYVRYIQKMLLRRAKLRQKARVHQLQVSKVQRIPSPLPARILTVWLSRTVSSKYGHLKGPEGHPADLMTDSLCFR